MSVILLDKNKFRILLKEDLTSGKYNPLNPYSAIGGSSSDPTEVVKNLGGDDAGSAKARSEYLRGKIEKNFSELGIPSYDLMGYMKAQGIFTLELIQQYNEPFDFSFVKEDGQKFSGKAIYNKELSEKFKTLVLDLNNGKAKIKFTPESLKRPFLAKKGLWGKYKDKLALMGLQTNGFFDVEISGDLSSKSEEGTKGESDYNVGDDISFKTDGGKKGKGKISKIEGDEITVTDSKGNEIVIGKGDIIVDSEEQGPTEKEGNLYNGKDIKEVNQKLTDLKDKANFFGVIKQYKDDEEFQQIFLDAIINTTKSIKINQKPLLKTLTDLRNNGLLESPTSMSGSQRKFLKIKLNLQNFMVDVFSLFAKVAKNGKNSKTYEVIKDFYKQLFFIVTKGKSHISDKQTRAQLWRKLMGSFSNFLKAISKLPEMTKGKPGKPEEKGKEVKVKNMPKANMNTMESLINTIASNVKLITEEENSIEKIKVLKISILQDLNPDEEEEGGNKKGEPNQISNKNFIKCKADLKFETEEDDTIFDKSTKKQITDGLFKGSFFVRMTQKPKGLVLIFSKTNTESGSFFTLVGKNIKSPKDPNQWKGEVVVGDKAMGNKDFKGSKAFIKKLVLSE